MFLVAVLFRDFLNTINCSLIKTYLQQITLPLRYPTSLQATLAPTSSHSVSHTVAPLLRLTEPKLVSLILTEETNKTHMFEAFHA